MPKSSTSEYGRLTDLSLRRQINDRLRGWSVKDRCVVFSLHERCAGLRRQLVERRAATAAVTVRHTHFDQLLSRERMINLNQQKCRQTPRTDLHRRSELMAKHAQIFHLLFTESHLRSPFRILTRGRA